MLTTWPPPRRPRFLLLKGEKNKCFCSTCFLLFRFNGEGAMLKTQLSICFKIYFPSDFKSLFLPFSISICLINLRLCSSSVSTCLVSSVYFYSFFPSLFTFTLTFLLYQSNLFYVRLFQPLLQYHSSASSTFLLLFHGVTLGEAS